MRAVFLDRDGVINENRRDHVRNWDEFHFVPGAPEAVARLSRAGVPVFVVTNQAIINRGLASWDTVNQINHRMVKEIERRGGRIEAVVACPHLPEERCPCRKPQPGMLLRLAREHGLDLTESIFVGDALTDIEAGEAAGCQTILVLTGRGRDELARALATGRRGFGVAPDLGTAVSSLLEVLAPAA